MRPGVCGGDKVFLKVASMKGVLEVWKEEEVESIFHWAIWDSKADWPCGLSIDIVAVSFCSSQLFFSYLDVEEIRDRSISYSRLWALVIKWESELWGEAYSNFDKGSKDFAQQGDSTNNGSMTKSWIQESDIGRRGGDEVDVPKSFPRLDLSSKIIC